MVRLLQVFQTPEDAQAYAQAIGEKHNLETVTYIRPVHTTTFTPAS
jgi:hypothetical protein